MIFLQIFVQHFAQNGEFCPNGTPHTRNKHAQQSPSCVWLFSFCLLQLFLSRLKAASHCNKLHDSSLLLPTQSQQRFEVISQLFLFHLSFKSFKVISQNSSVFVFFKNEESSSVSFSFFWIVLLGALNEISLFIKLCAFA